MKIIYGFRGIIFGLAVRLNNAPLRCNKHTALPERCLMGLTRRSGKKYTPHPFPLSLRRGGRERWNRAWVATEWNETMGWGMKWSFTGSLCVEIFVRGKQPISEME